MKRRSSSQLWEMTTASSASVTRLSSQSGRPGGTGRVGDDVSAVAARKHHAFHQRLLASRLAPCRPV